VLARHRSTDMAQTMDDEVAEVRLGWFENIVGFHLRKAQEAAFAAFKSRVDGLDIRVGHFAALMLIRENPGISQTALGKAIGRDKSSLTPILDDLSGRGLVVRYGLSLSEEGQRLCVGIQKQAALHEQQLVELIEPEDVSTFVRILKRIATIMPNT
jgi:DNA-binding MarR family transcriptional regulator